MTQTAPNPLLTMNEAAAELGTEVKAATVKRVASQGNLLYRMGRTPMVQRSDLPEIVRLCRVKNSRPGSTSGPQEGGKPHGTSDTKAGNTLQDALKATLAELKTP